MFQINVNPDGVLGDLNNAQNDQLPFAVSLALNRTANKAQEAQRQHLQAAFSLRRTQFVLRGIKIDKADRATKTSWRVVIQVAAQTDFLDRAEEGDPHVPVHGKWLWKPNPDVFDSKVIMRDNPLHPANLHFRSPWRGIATSQLQGEQGTFMVKTKKSGELLVLQRVARAGKGVSQAIALGARHQVGRDAAGRFTQGKAIKAVRRGGVRMLYQLVARSHVPAKLEFVSTITKAVDTAFPWEMQQAWQEAMRPRS